MNLSKRQKVLIGEVIGVTLIFSFVLFLAAKFLPSAYNLSKSIGLYDEGILLTGAKRLVNGEMIYRDFWAIYPPLNYLGLASFFKLFGQSIFVEKFYNIVVALFGLISIYWLFRLKTGKVLALIACLFLFGFTSPLKLTHIFIFLTMISVWGLFRNPKGKYSPYIVGLAVGLTFITRLDFGLLTGAVAFVAILILSKWNIKKIVAYCLKVFAGFVAPLIPLLIWIASQNALGQYLQQNYWYPFFGNFVAQRKLPIPDLFTLEHGLGGSLSFAFNWFFWLFVVIFFVTLFFLKKLDEDKKFLNVFALLVAGSLPYIMQRSDSPHLIFVNILAFTFFYFTIFSISKFKLKYFLISLLVPLLLFYYPFKIVTSPDDGEPASSKVYSFYSQELKETNDNDELEAVVNYVKENIDENEPIFIGMTDHSKLFINNVTLYFLLPNEIPTMYHELHPGVADTREIQEQIIEEIKKVKYVILWDFFMCEPNESCNSTEVYLLDEYIKSNYSVVETFGQYQILKHEAL